MPFPVACIAATGNNSRGQNAAINPWYDPNGVGLSVWEAWLAKSAASYAASILGLKNGRNLTETNGPVPWTAAGWGFVTADGKALLSGFTAAIDQSQAIFVKYAGGAFPALAYLAGSYGGADRFFGVAVNAAASNVYTNGDAVSAGAPAASRNLAVIGNQGYNNGVAEGVAIGAWGGANAVAVTIGARNAGGGPSLFVTATIEAVVVYDDITNVVAQAPAIVAAMAAL